MLAILWRTVRYLLNFPLWGDEAFLATSFFTRGPRGLVGPLECGQIAPLGFLWGEWLVTRVVGLSERGLRLLPFLIGLASVPMFGALAAAMYGRRKALLAVAVFAAAYFPMRYGVELKPYGLDMLVAMGLTLLAIRALERPNSTGRGVALILGAAAGAWLSYPSVFISGAVGLALTLRLAREVSLRSLCIWAGFGICLVGSFAAMLKIHAEPQMRSASWLTELPMWTSAFPPITQPLKLAVWLIDTHAGELLAYPIGGKHGGSAISLVLAVVGAVGLWRASREKFILLLGPLPLTFIAAAMHRYPYGGGPRVSLYMAPGFCLLIGAGLATLLGMLPRRAGSHRLLAGATLAGAVMACIAVSGIVRDIVHPYIGRNDLESRRVIRDLAVRSPGDDQWVVYNALAEVTDAPNLYMWGGTGATFRYYVTRYGPRSVSWGPPPGTTDAARAGRIWLLAYHDNKTAFPQGQFEAYLAKCTAVWGVARREMFRLGGAEAIEVFCFPG